MATINYENLLFQEKVKLELIAFEMILPQWMSEMVNASTQCDIIGLMALLDMLKVGSSFI